ncbi:fam-c protein [Plasmodium vinckei]|uniref:Fam-c protein n=1 Tax=Plasmodium vinckei TaxID=5860 RepID=A0A6V7SIJ8_PLAVN|nr:fam-c protein [Plasmodium vinckei]
MNKKIFSLVCIILYVLVSVSIHCSEQKNDRSKTSGLRSRIIRAIKKIQRSSKKNDIESERETQLNNNNNNDYQKFKDYNMLYGDDEACNEYFCGCLGNIGC